MKITPDGGFSFGNTSTAYGASGQVLTSAGDAPPTWETPTNGVVESLTTTGTSGAATLSAAGVLNIPNYADGNDNDYLTGLAFNTTTGVLTATVQNQSDVTVDLDGRYLTSYTVPLASSTVRGGMKIGFAESGKNYPVELSSEKAYVNVPWTDNNSVDYINAATFNTGNGIITGTGIGNAGFTVDIDGRYLTSYTETDTLATVTSRGATTSTACSFTNTTSFLIGGSGSANLYLGNIINPSSTNRGARFHSNNSDFYFDFQGDTTQNWFLRDYDGLGGIFTKFGFNFINGTFTAAGDIVAYGSPSDKRLKENIKPIESALHKAMKLQGVTFDWKENDSALDLKEDIGFIAQDVQKVLPELVRENKDGMLSMRHQGIAPILLEAIKELKAEIEELKLNKCNCNK